LYAGYKAIFPPKRNSNEFTDVGESKDEPFTMQIITLFTGIQVSRVVTSAADILSLAEEICHLCEKPVGTLRLLSDGVIIDPWCKSWKSTTFGDLQVFEDKTMFVYFLPMEHDEILARLGPDGTAEAWAAVEQKLRISKRISKNLQDQCAKAGKEKSDLLLKISQMCKEKDKLLVKHGDLANEFASAKKKLKNQSQNYRNEMKKVQSEKRNFQKKYETTSAKLQEALVERDRLSQSERNLRHQVERFTKDLSIFEKQHEQAMHEKEDVEKENAYLRQRLKRFAFANSSIDSSGHHHHHHHHHHLPDISYRRPSSTPSENGNESLHSLPLSDHSMPQNSEHSSPWSSASSAETSGCGVRDKLTIIDDSHYASPTLLPATSLDETKSHRYLDASRYKVPSFIQNRQPNSSPKGYVPSFY